MPRRKRRDLRAAAAAEPKVDPSVALFAQRHRAAIDDQRDQQRARAAEKARAAEHERLIAAKADAVAAIKRLNRTERATTAQRAEAEAAYRAATADLIAHETGERPSWAPRDPEAGPITEDPALSDHDQPADDATDS